MAHSKTQWETLTPHTPSSCCIVNKDRGCGAMSGCSPGSTHISNQPISITTLTYHNHTNPSPQMITANVKSPAVWLESSSCHLLNQNTVKMEYRQENGLSWEKQGVVQSCYTQDSKSLQCLVCKAIQTATCSSETVVDLQTLYSPTRHGSNAGRDVLVGNACVHS